MNAPFVDIHTHCPTGRHIELRAAGVHPWEAGRRTAEEALRELTTVLDAGGVQAVGEIGLDFVQADTPEERNAQIILFRAQLVLACERRLPVILHCVKAFEETMRILGEQEPPHVIFHGFVGSPQQAQQVLKRGYYLSFGERTFASPRTVEAMKCTPLSQLFLETDESPTSIETMYARIAVLRPTDIETLKRAVLENYRRIFDPE